LQVISSLQGVDIFYTSENRILIQTKETLEDSPWNDMFLSVEVYDMTEPNQPRLLDSTLTTHSYQQHFELVTQQWQTAGVLQDSLIIAIVANYFGEY